MAFDRIVKTWIAINSWRTYLISVVALLCVAVAVEICWSWSLMEADAVVTAISSREVSVSGRKFDSLSVEYKYVIDRAVFHNTAMSVSPVSREVLGHFRYSNAKTFVREHPIGTHIPIFISRVNPKWSGLFNDGLLGTLWLFSFWIAIPLSNALLRYQRDRKHKYKLRASNRIE